MNHHLLKVTLNFLAVVLLIAIVATPLYFARQFSKIAGVKSTSPYLVVSQIEKFPNLKLLQEENTYKISFQKQGPVQAYLGVLIVNNPTNQTQTYAFNITSGTAKLFFGEDLQNQQTQISVPAGISVPISLLSDTDNQEAQTVKFAISVM